MDSDSDSDSGPMDSDSHLMDSDSGLMDSDSDSDSGLVDSDSRVRTHSNTGTCMCSFYEAVESNVSFLFPGCTCMCSFVTHALLKVWKVTLASRFLDVHVCSFLDESQLKVWKVTRASRFLFCFVLIFNVHVCVVFRGGDLFSGVGVWSAFAKV